MCYFLKIFRNFSSRLDENFFFKNSRIPDSKIFWGRKFKSFLAGNGPGDDILSSRYKKMGNSNTKETYMVAPTPSGRSVPQEAPEKEDFVIDNIPEKTVRGDNL